jgi:hypothetical protein
MAASIAKCLDLIEPQETRQISDDQLSSLTKKRIDNDFLTRLLSSSTTDAFGYLIATYGRASQEGRLAASSETNLFFLVHHGSSAHSTRTDILYGDS